MKMSRRAKRMQRNHKRNKTKTALNLTALMDIFTILVFFLMVNQSDVQVQNSESVVLPVSTSEKTPSENLIVLITRDQVLVQGRAVEQNTRIQESEEEVIEALASELAYHRGSEQEGESPSLPVTVLGDKNTPYSVLKKVINTCAKSGFTDVSLAVSQQQGGV